MQYKSIDAFIGHYLGKSYKSLGLFRLCARVNGKLDMSCINATKGDGAFLCNKPHINLTVALFILADGCTDGYDATLVFEEKFGRYHCTHIEFASWRDTIIFDV